MAASDSIVSILKSVIHGRRPANDIKKAGQPYVNFADMQFGVIDTAGKHQDLLPIRFWMAGTTYAVLEMVVYKGRLYKCKTANHDATWKIANWTVETDIVVSWANVTGKPTTFPIDAAATALIAAAKKAGTDATALTVVNKTAAAAAMAKANAVTKLAGPVGPSLTVGTVTATTGNPTVTKVGTKLNFVLKTGATGTHGTNGTNGKVGPVGPALAVSHTVHATTGNPSIARSGNTLTFTLKTGATGGRGLTGGKGATGSRGPTGHTGAAGAKAKVTSGTGTPTGGVVGDLYIQR